MNLNFQGRRLVMGIRESSQERDDRWADELADQVYADVRDPTNEYYFARADNVSNGIGEVMADAKEPYSMQISQALIGGDDAAVGRIVKDMLISYWKENLKSTLENR